MEWWASPQTVGVSAVVAAGALVVGGIMARVRESRAAPDAAPTSTPNGAEAMQPGPRVMVVGVMKVEGLCCSRFEDATPVAASTFHEPRGDKEEPSRTWSAQAKNLWVDVGQVRIALDGPVRVEVGSEEHYPGCATDELEGRVVQRIFSGRIVPSRDNVVPLHGVFRSVKPDDQVAVVGRMERGPSVSKKRRKWSEAAVWRLTPDASGAITICYRRRPTVRGALFGVHAWAAALVGTLLTPS
jgi:hypothetical protein